MAFVAGCEIPEGYYFDVERDVWVRFEPDGLVTLGMTDLAQTRAGRLVNVLFRSPGRVVRPGGAIATIESAKWVGPLPAPFTLEIVETNEAAFRKDILIANKDPYGQGWFVRVRPVGPESELAHLVTGEEAVQKYAERILSLRVSCLRCIEEVQE